MRLPHVRQPARSPAPRPPRPDGIGPGDPVPTNEQWEALDNIDEFELMIGAATTIIDIPAAVRREVAQCQNLVHQACGSMHSRDRDRGAVLEIVFGATVLGKTKRGARAATLEVRQRCKRFLAGEWGLMWKWRQKPEIKHDDSKDKRLCRALKGCEALAKKGRFTDAMTELNMWLSRVKIPLRVTL